MKPFEQHVHKVLKNSTIGPTSSLFQHVHLENRYSLRGTQALVDHDYCEEYFCQERVDCNNETGENGSNNKQHSESLHC